MTPLGRRGLAVILLIVGAGVGCKKEKDSLVVVTLTSAAGDTGAAGVTTANVTVADGENSVTKKFTLANGIPTAGVTVGVYVSSDLTGSITVSATASKSGSCVGESGNDGRAKIDSAGDTVQTMVSMTPSQNVCGVDGGAGGAGGGRDGGAGMAGNGGGGSSGGARPPSFNCTEYDQGSATACSSTCSPAAADTAVYGVAFSPIDSTLLVTGSTDGRIKVWKIANRTLTAQTSFTVPTPTFGVISFSPDGSLLAVGITGGVEIWTVSTWTLQRTLSTASGAEAFGVAFSPDGQQVISITSTTLYDHAVDNVTAQHTASLTDGFSLAVSPVGSTLVPVAVATTDGTVLLYSLASSGFSTPSTLTVTSDGSVVETVQFSPNGSLLAAGGDDGFLRFWNVPLDGTASSGNVDIFDDTVSSVADSVAFSPNGMYVAIGGGEPGDLTGWTVVSPSTEVGTEFQSSNDVVGLAFAPDDSIIVGGEFDCGCVVACPQ